MDDQKDTNTPLKSQAAYVVVERWPQDGIDWVHPDDQDKISGLFPSDLIFRRECLDNGYYLFSYGKLNFRVRPILVNKVPKPKFWIGDKVTLKSNVDERKPFSGKVYEIRHSHYYKQAQYYLQRGEMLSESPFLAEELVKFDQHEHAKLSHPNLDDDPELPRIPLD